jgi:Na+-transporting NADH:ubiquinone oxidoreductase subunit A
VAVLPEKIPFIKPRLLVKENQPVSVGTTLFEDKRDPRVKFLSPGGGTVEAVDYGPRRVIRRIVIRLDQVEAAQRFEPFEEGRLRRTDRRDLVDALLAGGLWPLLRALPFRDHPRPESRPPAVVVGLDDSEPFQPETAVYLAGRSDLFAYGLQVLQRLAPRVMVVARADRMAGKEEIASAITHIVEGAYPAEDPGTVVYHTRGSAEENRTWFIGGQDLLLIARLLRDGRYPVERIVAVGGPAAESRRHVAARAGAPLAALAQPADGRNPRWVVGGVLRGFAGDADGYLGFFETALTLLPLGDEREFLAFVRPGAKKPSFSRTFLSALGRDPLPMDCNLHGELRPCVGCNACVQVCPVEILPQLTYKSLLADDIEEALAHGLLDCVACGLCTYVCPAKIELCEYLTAAKRRHHQEQDAG